MSATSFSPFQSLLATSSWDKSVRLWDIFEHKGNIDKLIHTTDGKLFFYAVVLYFICKLATCTLLLLVNLLIYFCSYFYLINNFFTPVVTHSFCPDGKELAVATLDGQISFWDVINAIQTGSIEGHRDLQVGRRVADRITANKMAGNT